MTSIRSFVLALGIILLAGCQARYPHEPKVIGAITYNETFGLPAMATLDVELLDLSATGGPQLIAQQHVIRRLRKPIAFSIAFDPKQIDQAHDYVIDARINVGTNVWFRTDTPVPVITKGHSQVQTIILNYHKPK